MRALFRMNKQNKQIKVMLGANNKPIIKCIQMLSYSFRIWYDFYSHYIICLFVTIVYSLHWSRKKFLKTIWQFNRNECHFLLLSLLLLPPPPPSSLLLMLMSLLLNAKAQPRTRTYIYHRIKKTNKMKKKIYAKQINAQIQWIVIQWWIEP